MAYLIFSTLKGRELARQALDAPLVVGRSPDSDVCVHDILLSRHHCRFEPHGKTWVIADLASKNGTHLNEHEILRHVLKDGESIRIGKTAVKFCAGKYERIARGGAAFSRPNKPRARPADPWSALHDTMSGFDYVKVLADEKRRRVDRSRMVEQAATTVDTSNLPHPQPTPRDPNAYRSEDVYSLLTELASSSWDSIYMNVSRPAPTRPPPRPMISRSPRQRKILPAEVSMQVTTGPGLLAYKPARGLPSKPRPKLRRALFGMARGFATIGQSVLVLGIVHLLGQI